VGGEDGAELKALEQGIGLAAAALVDELLIRDGDVVDRIFVGVDGDLALALAQRLHAVVLLADVGEVEERDEGAHEQRGVVLVELLDDVGHVLEGLVLGRRLVGVVVHRDGVEEQHVEDGAQVLVGLLEHLAHQAQEQRHVVADLLGDVHALERAEGGLLLDGELRFCQRVSLRGAVWARRRPRGMV